ncbi:MAG TPA: CDP-diacylglycerol--serine O-phosphatidyltransferase [Planctomycetota bacterium]|nr:CDP-diacylglycerol--serine O-phosphatidyltransferase [Planctomycetota bacterium]
MRKIAAVPSMLTLGNLLCGFHAVYFAAKGGQQGLELAAWMVLLAMVFDSVDGLAARLTHVESRFGAELDSLADVVSFGVAPAFLVAVLSATAELQHQRLVWMSCMVYVVCAALRLARFNVQTGLDEESHKSFVGLPSPAAAGQVATLIILDSYLRSQHNVAIVSRILPTVTFFAGALMVSRVPYPHLMSRLVRRHHTFAEFAFLAIVALLVATHTEFTLAAGFSAFTVTGVVVAIRRAILRRAEDQEPIF